MDIPCIAMVELHSLIPQNYFLQFVAWSRDLILHLDLEKCTNSFFFKFLIIQGLLFFRYFDWDSH